MTVPSPRLPDDSARRSRGLLIAVIVLLLAVIGLSVTLILTLTREDTGRADAPTIGVTDEPQTEPAVGTDGGPSDGAEPSADSAVPGDTDPQADASGQDAAADPAVLFDEQHRDPDDPYARGDADADIVIVQYADYRCGYCAQWHVEVADALDPYIESGEVRFEYRDHPVLGDASVYAALAARAAGNQGLFWEYGDALYRDTYSGVSPLYDAAYFTDVAERVGVEDIETFRADLTDADAYVAIMSSRQRALSLGITGTPSFIVHDTLVPGAIDKDRFVALVESRLA